MPLAHVADVCLRRLSRSRRQRTPGPDFEVLQHRDPSGRQLSHFQLFLFDSVFRTGWMSWSLTPPRGRQIPQSAKAFGHPVPS